MSRMKTLYDKSIQTPRASKIPPKEYVKRLCQKVVSDCASEIRNKQGIQENQDYPAFDGSGYAPVQKGNYGCITATGEPSDKMMFKEDIRCAGLQSRPSASTMEELMQQRMFEGGYKSNGMPNNQPPSDIDFSLDYEGSGRNRKVMPQ
jgi:hypothetical protein